MWEKSSRLPARGPRSTGVGTTSQAVTGNVEQPSTTVRTLEAGAERDDALSGDAAPVRSPFRATPIPLLAQADSPSEVPMGTGKETA